MSELKTSSAAGWDFCQDFSFSSVFLLGFSIPPVWGSKKKNVRCRKKQDSCIHPRCTPTEGTLIFIILFHCGNTEGNIVETKGDDQSVLHSKQPIRLVFACRPSVGRSTGHIIGLIVPANSNLVPPGLGRRPARMLVFCFISLLSFSFSLLFLSFLPFLVPGSLFLFRVYAYRPLIFLE